MLDDAQAAERSGAGMLARFRQRAGLTQFELASRADISRSMVAQLEMGERRPSRKLLARLAEAMSLPSDDLDRLNVAFGFTPEGNTPEQIAAFLRADKRLSQAQAEQLANLMRAAYARALESDGGEPPRRNGSAEDDLASTE